VESARYTAAMDLMPDSEDGMGYVESYDGWMDIGRLYLPLLTYLPTLLELHIL
jgi:hypothetical protein